MQAALAPTPKNGSVQLEIFSRGTDYKILCTNRYDLFSFMKGNRPLDPLHQRRLVESMRKKQLICPLIVNKKFQIIDGQNRFAACKELGLPVYYFMVPEYGIEEVQMLNSNQKNWRKLEHLHSFCESGIKPYLLFKKFMGDFPELSFQACERILTGTSDGRKNGQVDGKSVHMKDFETGKLSIPDLEKSYTCAQKIMDFRDFYRGFHKGMFATVMLAVFKNKNYNHKEMLHKLAVCPIKLRDCLNVDEYKILLEDIYNHKRLKGNRVSFKYD